MAPGVDRVAGQSGLNPFLQASIQNSNGVKPQSQTVALKPASPQTQPYQFDSVVFGNGKPKTATDWLQDSLSGAGSGNGRIINQTA